MEKKAGTFQTILVGFRTSSFFCRLFRAFLLSFVQGPEAASYESLLEMQNFRSYPKLLNRILHFNKILRWLLCMLIFKKLCVIESFQAEHSSYLCVSEKLFWWQIRVSCTHPCKRWRGPGLGQHSQDCRRTDSSMATWERHWFRGWKTDSVAYPLN